MLAGGGRGRRAERRCPASSRQAARDAGRDRGGPGVRSTGDRERIREAGMLVEAAADAQTVAFVEIRAGDHATQPRHALRDGIAELDRLGNRSYRGTTALMLADLLAKQGAHEEAAQLCADVRETLNDDDLTDVIAVDALAGVPERGRGETDGGRALSARAVDVAATIDMYESKARAYRVARAHARARRQAARGPRGSCHRARDLRGQGRHPRKRLGARAARLALRLSAGRLGWRQRNGELGHDRAERVAQRAADPQNLIWVMPAEVCAWRSRPSSSLPEGIPPLVACPSCRRMHT